MSVPGMADGESLAEYGAELAERLGHRSPVTDHGTETLIPLEAVEAERFDLQGYLDERRDGYLKAERLRLKEIAETVGQMSVADTLRMVRAAFVAGASAMADGVTARDGLRLIQDEEAMKMAERRIAMRKELARYRRTGEMLKSTLLPWGVVGQGEGERGRGGEA